MHINAIVIRLIIIKCKNNTPFAYLCSTVINANNLFLLTRTFSFFVVCSRVRLEKMSPATSKVRDGLFIRFLHYKKRIMKVAVTAIDVIGQA